MNILLLEVFLDGFKNALFHCVYTHFFMTYSFRYDFFDNKINSFLDRFLSFAFVFIVNLFL